MMTRREIVRRAAVAGAAVAGGLPVVGGARNLHEASAQPATPAAVTHSRFDPWVEIRPDHLVHNLAEIRRRAGGRPIIAVVKNNGYGGGVDVVGRLLDARPEVSMLAVVKLAEALALRAAGVRKPILLLGPSDDGGLEEAVVRGIEPMIYTPPGDVFERIATRRQQATPVHVCVDTGIGRVGVPYREAAALIRALAARRSVRIASTMMTFSEDATLDAEQILRFTALCDGLASDGIRLGPRHAASSFALFERPDGFFDCVRPGMAVFGIYSEPQFRTLGLMDLRPALSLKARVAYVKQLQPGDSAGYNRAYVATKPVWIATLPVGHADGWPRAAAKGARIAIGGRLYPVVASVSASHTIVEIGDTRAVSIGDEATLFGWEPGGRPEDVAAACGASVYDLTMHLNALLPRRTV
jgi:alanine racemase